MGSLSNLYSDNDKPYLDYRVAENLFCMCLEAENLSRTDCTADASKDEFGIGIKTFLNNATNNSMQKIAEFNRQRNEYAKLNALKMIKMIALYRNERIEITKRIHGLNEMIYHCLIRDIGIINIVETQMDRINIDKIKIAKSVAGRNVIYFDDGINDYSFNLSKSVLYKRFENTNSIFSINIEMIENPYLLLKELFSDEMYSQKLISKPVKREKDHLFLPLYAMKRGIKFVPEKSGLNQWNAGGRKRNENEIYIPIPAIVHKKSPNFFPERNQPFDLKLPDGKIVVAKACQDNSKALMSNPNYVLGEWLLRHVMRLKEGELVTYDMLDGLGIDSVIVYKIDDETYSIDFTTTGKYEQYIKDED